MTRSQNLKIIDAVGSDAVQVYYDVYNTGITRGYDVPAEIRLLKGRIAQFHFKNGPQFLGQGKLQFEPILAAMKETGYQGWIVLETSSPTGNPLADARRNGAYLRELLGGDEPSPYPFFPFCIDWHDAKKRSFEQQAEMLKSLGYDGVGHIWLDKVAERLKTLDAAGLKLYQITMTVDVAPGKQAYDPRFKDVLRWSKAATCSSRC